MSSEKKYTPGPWSVEIDNYDYNDGLSVSSKDFWICKVWENSGEDTANADANLIAAAPELLEALEAFVTACDSAPPIELIQYISRACDNARIAIAKAKGENK